MKPEQITEALEAAAAHVGVQVRYDALAASGTGSAGGLCKVRGQWWVIIDKKATPAERLSLLADALVSFDTSQIELPAKAREVLEARRALRASTVS